MHDRQVIPCRSKPRVICCISDYIYAWNLSIKMATYPKLSSVVTAINCIILALRIEMFEQLARKGTSRKLNPVKLVTAEGGGGGTP